VGRRFQGKVAGEYLFRREPCYAAALLAIVEGMTLVEMACPGSTEHVGAFVSRALDGD
jgi:hypothetical protein